MKEANQATDPKHWANNNWVDRYLLRYGPGSILGALLSAHFYAQRSLFGIAWSVPRDDYKFLGMVFLAIGFLFCYISSAPILVFHFSRSIYLPRKIANRFDIASTGIMLVASIVVALVLCVFFHVSVLVALNISISTVLIMSFYVFALWAYIARNDVYRFYRALALRRQEDQTGFVESYRTMREHGNAFYIILFELVLTGYINGLLIIVRENQLIVDPDFALLILIFLVLIWLFPAALAWYVAGHLESDFVAEGSSG